MMENVASLASGLGAAGLLPDVSSLFGKLELIMRLLLMVGPLAMLGLGLYYFLAAPKEANYSVGYRLRYAMSRVEVWQFTQRLAGIAYGGVGLVLTIVMAILSTQFGGKEIPDLIWFTFRCALWQLGTVIATTEVVNLLVIILFDRKGNRRKFAQKSK